VWVQGEGSAGFALATNIRNKPLKDGKIKMGKILSTISHSHESAKFIHVVHSFGRTSIGHKTRSYQS